MATCTECRDDTGDPTYTWPGPEPDSVLCQNCWEADCDRGWWEMVMALYGPGVPRAMEEGDG